MNALLKSVFISLYISLLVAASCHIAYQLAYAHSTLFWLALAVSVMPQLTFFLRLFIAPVARTSANLYGIILLAFVGLLLSALLATHQQEYLYTILYGACLSGLGSLLYVFWYSRFPKRDSQVIEIGKALPNINLQTLSGDSWNSNASLKRTSLFMFYRGNWCPLCMAQIKEVAKEYQHLTNLGVDIYLVSPQPQSHIQSLASKFQVNFHFMQDVNNQAAKVLGIFAKQGTPKGMEVLGYDSDTVMPTVIITDESKNIIFCDQTDNYRVRPEPATFIKILQAL